MYTHDQKSKASLYVRKSSGKRRHCITIMKHKDNLYKRKNLKNLQCSRSKDRQHSRCMLEVKDEQIR